MSISVDGKRLILLFIAFLSVVAHPGFKLRHRHGGGHHHHHNHKGHGHHAHIHLNNLDIVGIAVPRGIRGEAFGPASAPEVSNQAKTHTADIPINMKGRGFLDSLKTFATSFLAKAKQAQGESDSDEDLSDEATDADMSLSRMVLEESKKADPKEQEFLLQVMETARTEEKKSGETNTPKLSILEQIANIVNILSEKGGPEMAEKAKTVLYKLAEDAWEKGKELVSKATKGAFSYFGQMALDKGYEMLTNFGAQAINAGAEAVKEMAGRAMANGLQSVIDYGSDTLAKGNEFMKTASGLLNMLAATGKEDAKDSKDYDHLMGMLDGDEGEDKNKISKLTRDVASDTNTTRIDLEVTTTSKP